MINPQYVDGLELRIKELTHQRNEYRNLSDKHGDLWRSERDRADALAAHVERLTKAAFDAIHYLPCGKNKAELMDAYDDTPETSLARLKAQWQAEALEWVRANPYVALNTRITELRRHAEEDK